VCTFCRRKKRGGCPLCTRPPKVALTLTAGHNPKEVSRSRGVPTCIASASKLVVPTCNFAFQRGWNLRYCYLFHRLIRGRRRGIGNLVFLLPPKLNCVPRSSVPGESCVKGWHLLTLERLPPAVVSVSPSLADSNDMTHMIKAEEP
jgi:hypothetical protein